MREILKASYLAGAGVLVAGLLFSLAVTRPINRLVDYAQAVRRGDRRALPRLTTPEFQRLGEAFEEMRLAVEGRNEIEAYVQALTHEIKSPLTAIRGAGELLEEDLPVAERKRFLENIRVESSRIQHIVDSLLDLAALESRKGLERVEDLDLKELVQEVLESLRPEIIKKDLVVSTQLASARVSGERFLLVQALRNLVQNAIDFSPTAGAIALSLSASGIFEVRDQGPGIPDFALARVYERFYSLGRPSTGKKSSGLGLSFVKEVALLHRGSIEVSNLPGSGALATFSLSSDAR